MLLNRSSSRYQMRSPFRLLKDYEQPGVSVFANLALAVFGRLPRLYFSMRPCEVQSALIGEKKRSRLPRKSRIVLTKCSSGVLRV